MVDSNDDELEWAWLAGIVEGEGCIGRYLVDRKHPYYQTMIAVEMKDRDILERLHKITGVGSITTKPARRNSSETYLWKVTNRHHVVEICDRILPYMGVRRTAKIKEVVDGVRGR